MAELSPEQVAEIRKWCEPTKRTPEERAEERALCEAGECGGCLVCWGPPIKVAGCDDVLALCDTVEALRADLKRILYETAEHDTELGRTWVANQEMSAALVEANAELETLRGIVARIRDDWKPYEQANGSTPRWLRAGDAGEIEDDMLTAAEVEAIYGKEDGNDG